MSEIGDFFLPGDRLPQKLLTEKVNLLNGLRFDEYDDKQVVVSTYGQLQFKPPNTFWINNQSDKYECVNGDRVLGVVSQKVGDFYRVDIRIGEPASLSYLNFESATKRYRPDIKVGDLVYCRIIQADKHNEPELSCITSNGKANGMGIIGRGGGYVFDCSAYQCRRLLHKDCPFLKIIGKKTPFEVIVGLNGRIWLQGKNIKDTIRLTRAIQQLESVSDDEIVQYANKIAEQ